MKDNLLAPYRSNLETDRFTALEADLVLSAEDRRGIADAVFQDDKLEDDKEEVHNNRRRADAVLRFSWFGNNVSITDGPNESRNPLERQAIKYTANHEGTREYKRLRVLDVPQLVTLLRRILTLVPVAERHEEGILGVHAFRTFGDVVQTRHRDGSLNAPVQWVISYVVQKDGNGAESQLSRDQAGADIVATTTLEAGCLVMHFDEAFYHYVTPLTGMGSSPARRDAMIVTIRPKFE